MGDGKVKMAEGQYLNEERYQKNRKKLMGVAVAILITGMLIGGGLLIGGIIKKNSASQIDDSMPTYSSTSSFDDNVNSSRNWMNRASDRADEEFEATAMMTVGGFIVFASIAISIPFFIWANGRAIMAFQAQTVAPVAKEGVEKAAPVVGKAVGGIAKEVAKGVKEGMKEGESEAEKPEKD